MLDYLICQSNLSCILSCAFKCTLLYSTGNYRGAGAPLKQQRHPLGRHGPKRLLSSLIGQDRRGRALVGEERGSNKSKVKGTGREEEGDDENKGKVNIFVYVCICDIVVS